MIRGSTPSSPNSRRLDRNPDGRKEGARLMDVTVWHSSMKSASDLIPFLDLPERKRLERFLRSEDGDRYATGRVLAKILVGEITGRHPSSVVLRSRCVRCGGEHGKPQVEGDGGVQLSIAHSHERVVAATAAVHVGVDVEHVRGLLNPAKLASSELSREENRVRLSLDTAERDRALLTYWVRKEALLKATGLGLSIPPRLVTITPPELAPQLVWWEAADCRPPIAALADVDVGAAYIGCVAVLSRGPATPSVFDVSDVLELWMSRD